MGTHAAVPTRGTRARRGIRPGTPGPGPAPGSHPGTHGASRSALVLPLVLGLAYGVYVAFMARGTGPLTWSNVWFGVLWGVILTAVALLVGRMIKGRTPGMRAIAIAVPFAAAMGYLFSLGGGSVLTSVVLALVLGAGMYIATYYAFYSHSD
ncbi:hypothetical protein [Streptomyces sp. NPDC058657]|uniref:hypothetical protein n=1 Tax=unclassified Streptomyces TaxID=2593676 RepID=UPI00365EDDEC